MELLGEQKIHINGVLLNWAQASTVRMALTFFLIDLDRDGLGEEKNSKKMCESYQDSIEEIWLLMQGAIK